MLNRRTFLASALAAGSLSVMPTLAQGAKRYALPREFLPKRVRLRKSVPAGEIHVDPVRFKLYWTLPGGRAIEYSVGVGRENLYEAGTFFIGAKKEWPAWTPTREMIARQPKLYAKWSKGMPGGPKNPLGARALYLFTRERGDTFLRIHGTNAPRTIGSAVSNGCTRLINDHAIELYNRVPIGTRVVLHPKGGRGWNAVAYVAETPVETGGRRNRGAQAAEDRPRAARTRARMCKDILGRRVRCNP